MQTKFSTGRTHRRRSAASAAALAALLLTAGALGTSAHAATDKPDPAAYPELSTDAILPKIMTDLKRTIADPYSIRDFLLCPARQIRLENGRPVKWTVDFAFNAKNENGGYGGLTPYIVGFRNGEIWLHATTGKLPGKDAFDAMINRAGLKVVLKCPAIADAKVQDMLSRPVSNTAQ